MKNETNNNIIYIIIATLVLLGLNAAVFIGIQQNKLESSESLVLWGIFAIFNVISLIWAVTVLGLHPLLLAISYVAGGALAYFGVRELPDINVPEIITAGAVYGGIGALTVGNAMVKMRTVFFEKGQVPFIFIVIGLLLLDGILNTKISHSDWPVFLNAMLLPFGIAGLGLGTVGVAIVAGLNKNAAQKEEEEARSKSKKKKTGASKSSSSRSTVVQKSKDAEKAAAEKVAAEKAAVEKAAERMVAEGVVAEEKAATEKVAAEKAAAEKAAAERAATEKAEADKMAAEKAAEKAAAEEKSRAERAAAEKAAAEKIALEKTLNIASEIVKEKEPEKSESVNSNADEKSNNDEDISSDWLSNQLNLLNKISKNEDKDK